MNRSQKILEIMSGNTSIDVQVTRNSRDGITYHATFNVEGHKMEADVEYWDSNRRLGIEWFINGETSRRVGLVSQKAIFRVFSVLAYMLDRAMKENDVKEVDFSSESSDTKKLRMYAILAKKIAQKYRGRIQTEKIGPSTVFVVEF